MSDIVFNRDNQIVKMKFDNVVITSRKAPKDDGCNEFTVKKNGEIPIILNELVKEYFVISNAHIQAEDYVYEPDDDKDYRFSSTSDKIGNLVSLPKIILREDKNMSIEDIAHCKYVEFEDGTILKYGLNLAEIKEKEQAERNAALKKEKHIIADTKRLDKGSFLDLLNGD